jgi:DNA polymerase II small subunit/DNA polymerase delta subunit B
MDGLVSGVGSALSAAALFADGGTMDFTPGGPVPGQAKFPGKNDPRNDTQKALLTPGEDVLPLSVTQAPDAPERAKKFVEMLQDRSGNSKGYGKILKARGTLKDRVERLEKMCAGGVS